MTLELHDSNSIGLGIGQIIWIPQYHNQPEIVEYPLTDLEKVEMQAMEAAVSGYTDGGLQSNGTELDDTNGVDEQQPRRNGACSVALGVMMLIGLTMIVISCSRISSPVMQIAGFEAAMGGSALPQPTKTPTGSNMMQSVVLPPLPTATLDYRQETLVAGQIELLQLANEGTRTALDILRDRATQDYWVAETDAAIRWTATAQVIATQAAGTAERIEVQRAQDTQAYKATLTLQAATMVAINRQIETDNQDANTLRQVMPVRRWIENLGQPVAICIGTVVLVIVISKKLARRKEDTEIGDGEEPEPDPDPDRIPRPAETSLIEVHHNDEKTINRFRLPCTDEQLIALARGLVKGEDLTEDTWVKKYAVFTQRKWYRVRNQMIKVLLAAWLDEAAHTQGAEMTDLGMDVMEEIVDRAGEMLVSTNTTNGRITNGIPPHPIPPTTALRNTGMQNAQ